MADTPLTPPVGSLTIPAGPTNPNGAVVLNPTLVAAPLGTLGAGK